MEIRSGFTEGQEAATGFLNGLGVIGLLPEGFGPEIDFEMSGKTGRLQSSDDAFHRSLTGADHAVVIFHPVLLLWSVIQLHGRQAVSDLRQSLEPTALWQQLAGTQSEFDRRMLAVIEQFECFVEFRQERPVSGIGGWHGTQCQCDLMLSGIVSQPSQCIDNKSAGVIEGVAAPATTGDVHTIRLALRR